MLLLVQETIVNILHVLTHSAPTRILEVGIITITIFQMCKLRQKVVNFPRSCGSNYRTNYYDSVLTKNLATVWLPYLTEKE